MIAIADSPDLRRILALPVRELEPPALPLEDLGGTLRPIQEEALRELLTYGGALVSARVGAGKTLISLLAGTVVGAKRPLLLVPAKLKKKTELEAKEYAAKGWKITMPYVMSYELLGRSQSATTLEDIKPDLVIFDEAHRLANLHAAVTRRVNRYLSAHPTTPVLAMSGTLTKRQLKDFAHVARWCCKEHNPTPTKYQEIELWSMALGAKVDAWARPKLGALGVFTSGETGDAYEIARRRYGERIWATPSCVQTTDGLPGVGLEISKSELKMGPAAKHAFDEMRRTWCTPGGEEITDAVALYRHSRELACGFYYKWATPPPRDWLEARRNWHRWVRETLSHSRTYDTPFQLALAVEQGKVACEYWEPWRGVRGSYEPKSVPVWIDDSTIRSVASISEPQLIWVEHDAVGRYLAELGIPYYGPQGRCTKTGKVVEHAEPSQAIAVSIRANGEGRNLQAWHKNLVLCPSQMGAEWEQMLGRTHRDGQEADTVEVEVFCPTFLHEQALRQAKKDAHYIHATTGQEQKLLTATWTFETEERK